MRNLLRTRSFGQLSYMDKPQFDIQTAGTKRLYLKPRSLAFAFGSVFFFWSDLETHRAHNAPSSIMTFQ